MQWLMAHMWMALAAAGLLAFLFGWAVRGLGLRGKLRRAEGERNIAVGSLQEKESELEALYAAGRTPATSEGVIANDGELQAELQERELKLQTLADELARSKAELNELRESKDGSGTLKKAGAVIAGAAAVKAISAAATASEAEETEPGRLDANIDEEEASLQWRNRYLESQVRTLQEKIQTLSAVPAVLASDVSSDSGDVLEAAPVETAGSGPEHDVAIDKLKWQNDYLRQRLQYFQTYGVDETTPETPSEIEHSKSIPEASEDALIEKDDASASDEDIAKLRWRNRYLEGRLAYYEGDKADAEEASSDSGIVGLAAGVAAAGVGAAALTADEDASTAADLADTPNDDIDFANIDLDEDVTDVVLDEVASETAELEDPIEVPSAEAPEDGAAEIGEKPLALEGPVGGEADDLTAIGGIGPKIEEVLHELGVYHYDQIAAWTKDNIDWVDEYLAFKGRIEREQWVEQASALSGDVAG